MAAAGKFPNIDPTADNIENQQHVTFFIHGYNSKWADEAARYQGICDSFFSGPDSLGECILYHWPSLGNVLGYLPDREHAVDCANDLADVRAVRPLRIHASPADGGSGRSIERVQSKNLAHRS
jgi:esterase/lipase superfamily enzyme